MTDLEELFRPLIEESAPLREPVAAIETRANARTSRRRGRQRVQYRFAAGFAVVALVATVVGVVHAGRDTDRSRVGPIVTTAPATNSSVPSDIVPSVPPGWKTYDYGLARLSVPPSYTAASGTVCPPVGPVLMLQPVGHTIDMTCLALEPTVTIQPIDTPAGFKLPGPRSSVNGIDYFSVPSHCPPTTSAPTAPVCLPSISVPALKVVISFAFTQRDKVSDIPAIIRTLTYSTYARFRQQPFGAAPASWKPVAFGGYSVRVPAGWRVVNLDRTNGFCTPERDTVYLGMNFSPGCPADLWSVAPQDPSLQLSTVPVDQHGTPSTLPNSTVLHHNGLSMIETPPSQPFVSELGFVVEGGPKPVQLILGLGLDATVARGILGSLKVP